MSDIELRQLERVYAAEPNEDNLYQLNLVRARMGLALIRRPNYLLSWFVRLHQLLPTANFRQSLIEGETISTFSGTLNINKYVVPLSIRFNQGEGDPSIDSVLEIVLRPLYPTLSDNRSCQLRIVIYEESVPGIQLYTPWKSSRELHEVIVNLFASADDLLVFLKRIYLQHIKQRWQTLLSQTEIDKSFFINMLKASIVIQRQKDILRQNTFLMAVLRTSWFQNALTTYSTEVERWIQEQDLVFDSENKWLTIEYQRGRYVLQLETGYNETVDLENFDESDPEGHRFGNVNSLVETFCGLLERITMVKWEVDWKYAEEPEEDSEDVPILIKAEASLTIPLLLTVALGMDSSNID